MVAYMHLMLLATACFQSTIVSALPTPGEISANWADSAFVICIKKTYPNYPAGVTDPNIVLGCRNYHKKRGVTDLEADNLGSRDIPGLVLAPGAECDGGPDAPLPKNFLVVTDIRAGAANWCDAMKSDLIKFGLGKIDQNFNNAVTKTANELHGHKGVALSILFAITPQGRAALKGATVANAALLKTCTEAITALATKGGQGCTRYINWYNAGKAKGQTSTGARAGGIDISNGPDDFGYMSMEFMAPS
jgi:hypothetical protein